MKSIFESFLILITRFALWFRYRIKVKGLEKLNAKNLSRPGGVLFLPNHPAMAIDPMSIAQAIWKKYPIRPVIVEYMYYMPVFHTIMKYIDAIPIPNNEVASNSLKKKQSDQAFDEVIKGLKMGQNFMVYPSGKLKDTGLEVIAGASGVQRILHATPEANVVLVRITGMWGSSFSKAYTGYSPSTFETIWRGVKKSFKNFLFFNPRRNILIEFEPVPVDFPLTGDRMEMNRYLEEWYNRPFGTHGEPLYRVSYSVWGEDLLEVPEKMTVVEESKLKEVPPEVQKKVIDKLAEMTRRQPASINPGMDISTDLALDSLDMAEIVLFLETEYDLKGIPVRELKTVGRLMEIAAKKVKITGPAEVSMDTSKWNLPTKKKLLDVAPGKLIPEVFLNNCDRMGKAMAVGDDRAGTMDYKTLKLRALLIADYIQTLPGKNIGIMLPASVAATIVILACQLAGKTPVMINWTVGRRHLESVVEISGIQKVLSSWTFLDRLGNVEIQPIEDMMILLEDVRRDFKITDKLKALYRSHLGATTLMKHYQLDAVDENDPAIILFTSGTESAPKGVPLSHRNLLSNIRAAFSTVDIFSTDVFYAILPPFHSFGLTAGCYFGVLSGMRVAFFPNPTDGEGLAKGVEKWGATIVCGAPTFLKGLLKSGSKEQLATLRFVVTGAEKAPPELMKLIDEKGLTGRLYEGYGVTECSPVLTLNIPGRETGGVGEPVEGVEILIVSEEKLEPQPVGTQGLILARGPNVFSGYLNKGLKSPFLTVHGKPWYNTGDLGYFDEMNRLYISGRLKRFIKVGGEMISLAAIEDALLKAAPLKGWVLAEEGPSVAICAKEKAGEKPEIYLFSIFGTSIEEVNNALRNAGFSNIVRVTHVKKLQELPIMGSGKIHYRELESKYT